jgi:hypothetical protein
MKSLFQHQDKKALLNSCRECLVYLHEFKTPKEGQNFPNITSQRQNKNQRLDSRY